jgi:hypothetical protein
MGERISFQERRPQEADERLLARLPPEQRDAVLWAVRKYPTLTAAKAVEMPEAAGGI